MRIGQIAASYQQQVRLQVQARSAGSTGSTGQTSQQNPQVAGQDRAKRANQARLDDATRGLGRAVAVHDGMTAVADALGAARAAVAVAQDGSRSTADRQQAQRDFAAAMGAIDKGAKAQRTALNDPALRSTAFDAARVPVLSADRLGSGRGTGSTTVADLARLDLTTASSDQLNQAAKVLDAASTQTDARRTAIGAQAGRISTTVARLQGVQDLLSGGGTGKAPAGGLPPGSLLDLRG
jgi:hypothetical protein